MVEVITAVPIETEGSNSCMGCTGNICIGAAADKDVRCSVWCGFLGNEVFMLFVGLLALWNHRSN